MWRYCDPLNKNDILLAYTKVCHMDAMLLSRGCHEKVWQSSHSILNLSSNLEKCAPDTNNLITSQLISLDSLKDQLLKLFSFPKYIHETKYFLKIPCCLENFQFFLPYFFSSRKPAQKMFLSYPRQQENTSS